jgi:hypothetical protein
MRRRRRASKSVGPWAGEVGKVQRRVAVGGADCGVWRTGGWDWQRSGPKRDKRDRQTEKRQRESRERERSRMGEGDRGPDPNLASSWLVG